MVREKPPDPGGGPSHAYPQQPVQFSYTPIVSLPLSQCTQIEEQIEIRQKRPREEESSQTQTNEKEPRTRVARSKYTATDLGPFLVHVSKAETDPRGGTRDRKRFPNERIWDTDGHGNWSLSSSWKAHHGSVWKVTWAHPEFGQVIATCSFDRTAAIWEEVGDTSAPGSERGVRQWVKRSNLVDSRTSVTDVKFGPKHLGLLLVTCSADGIIRIYEAPDVMNLAQWTLQHEIPVKISISSLSWNPSLSRVNPPMLAVGSDEPNMAPAAMTASTDKTNTGKVLIYEYSENSRRWSRTECISSIQEPVNEVAFAPNLGRSFHLLAVATNDVRIIKLDPITDPAGGSRYVVETVSALAEQAGCVWRVAWNLTGTMLASSADDCVVRLWKMQYVGEWKCVGVLQSGEGAGPAPPAPPSPPSPARAHTAYIKMAAIANPSHMPWH